MKSSIAALTLLAALGSTQDVRRDVTHLFSNPPQPTPNESTPTGLFSILPVSSDTASASHSGVTTTPSETAAPTTIGHISSNVTTGTGTALLFGFLYFRFFYSRILCHNIFFPRKRHAVEHEEQFHQQEA
ncbi:hypothetical protein ED733_003655 [Metarhizium rileyi]|uniref:Uncharacterized protein n=1 Tax=Metarhizium rileyi (strain RCEF 4871) TaxID=1649241 RepID=A0A5C6GHG6_METRR|nr:hypothetical protein ED733_003655 [Metarhizium rileyi]